MLLPGISAPPLLGASMMIGAGIAWGVYSLRGKGAGDPTRVTAGNFMRAVPITIILSLLMLDFASVGSAGFYYAVASGALASGLGYAIWYTVLPALKNTSAATVQLFDVGVPATSSRQYSISAASGVIAGRLERPDDASAVDGGPA